MNLVNTTCLQAHIIYTNVAVMVLGFFCVQSHIEMCACIYIYVVLTLPQYGYQLVRGQAAVISLIIMYYQQRTSLVNAVQYKFNLM